MVNGNKTPYLSTSGSKRTIKAPGRRNRLRRLLFGSHDSCSKSSANVQGTLRRLGIQPLEDRCLLAAYVVTNLDDSGQGSLRQAIVDANANPGLDIIEFTLQGEGPYSIEPQSPLPNITDAITINGTSQPGYAGLPLIELSGSQAGSNANGLVIQAAATISGLAINDFARNGILVYAAGTTISQNHIGTDASGSIPSGNGEYGIHVFGVAPPAGTSNAAVSIVDNLVSGQSTANYGAIQLSISSHVTIQGNKIGTDASGTLSVANFHGIGLDGTSNSTIGGNQAAEGNLISGNLGNGLSLSRSTSTDNWVAGNFFGTDVTGMSLLQNRWSAISLSLNATRNIIGGADEGSGNLISGNGSGILMNNQGGSHNIIQGNFIGTKANGTEIFEGYESSNLRGIRIDSGVENQIRDNILSGNGTAVELGASASGTIVESNKIGVDASTTIELGNHSYGIRIVGSANTKILSNYIRHTGGTGISTLSDTNTAILSNSIYNSRGTTGSATGLGIDIGDDGPNPQLTPTLLSVNSTALLTAINGSFAGVADAHYRIEYFASPTTNTSGFGEGRDLLAAQDLTADASGIVALEISVPQVLEDGIALSATATRYEDHDSDDATPLIPVQTSEFARSIIIGSAGLIDTLHLENPGIVSIGIYDDRGNLIRKLSEGVPYAAGDIPIFWDGYDDFGNRVFGGGYQWRAIAHQASAVDEGQVGDMAAQPYGLNEHSHFVGEVAIDDIGNVYESSFFEEAYSELRKWDADGNAVWSRGELKGGRGLAVDEQYLYAVIDRFEYLAIYRFDAATGADAPWANLEGGTIRIIDSNDGVFGMDVHADDLWISHHDGNEVLRFDKVSGSLIGGFPVEKPYGLVADANGDLWIANSGDRVTKFDVEGTILDSVSGFSDPKAVDIGGPASHLFVGDFATNTVHEIDVTTGAEVREMFGLGTPGPISDYRLRWSDGDWKPAQGDLAVNSDGTMVIADFATQRVLTYAADGSHLRTRFSEYIPAPFVDPNSDPDILLSGAFQYSVNYEAGENYGNWELTHHWRPNDGEYFNNTATIRRTLSNGKDYLFSLVPATGLAVYALEGDQLRRSAIVGADADGLWNWTDSDGNGQIEMTETIDAGGPETKLTFETRGPGMWVDGEGNLWITHWRNWQRGASIVKVPLLEFDAQDNPVYDWNSREVVVDQDHEYLFDGNNMRVNDATGELYVLGTSNLTDDLDFYFFMGGSVVDRRAADGTRLGIIHLSEIAVALAADSSGEYFYTGHSWGDQHWIRMYTSDGLFITEGRIGPNHGSHGGWIDHGMGITAFEHPNGERYVYAEEVFYGKSVRYRIDDIDTLQRFEGTFSWGEEPSFAVTNTNDSGPGSLRQAIIDSELHRGLDTITFDIPGTGVHTIVLESPLPEMSDPIIIDGTSEPDYSGLPVIEISGMNADPNGTGIKGLVVGKASEIRGLAIYGFTEGGIQVRGGGVTIEDNFLGTDATGTIAFGGYSGLLVDSGNPFIDLLPVDGWMAKIRDNVISGNDRVNFSGIMVSNSSYVLITGNFIGTDVSGTSSLPNFHGISLDNSYSVQIGGVSSAERNVISGNHRFGISISRASSVDNLVAGNFIGIDATGENLLANGNTGIVFGLSAQNNTIGGPDPNAGNFIAGGSYGIAASSGQNNLIQNNTIGSNASGMQVLSVKVAGITVGKGDTIFDNVLVGTSQGHGLRLSGDVRDNLISGNFIGTNREYSSTMGNVHGILISEAQGLSPSNNVFTSNTIAFNYGDGVRIEAGSGNTFLENEIYGNQGTSEGSTGAAIDLGGDGITSNDFGDSDQGPNGLQNTPELVSASAGANNLIVEGTLNSAPDQTYRLEFFRTVLPASNIVSGQAESFLGFAFVSTDTSGSATFQIDLPVGASIGEFISATATDTDGNTSEISVAVEVENGNLPPSAILSGFLSQETDQEATLNFSMSGLQDESVETLRFSYALEIESLADDYDSASEQNDVSFAFATLTTSTLYGRILDVGNVHTTYAIDVVVGSRSSETVSSPALRRAILVGLGGSDNLIGSQFDDVIYGGSGNDVVVPGLGADFVDAGAGNDRIEMHGGDLLGDVINGGSGYDVLINLDANTAMTFSSFSHASNQIERIEGAGGAIEGTAGDDFLSFVNVVLVDVPRVDAKEGNDTIEASTHTHDVVYIGGEGNDQLVGNQRRDILDGGIGNDTLLGDSGDDLLLPGLGDDIVDAGPGNDRIVMHGGNLLGDVVNGGSGYDVLINLDANTAMTFSSFSHASNQIERIEGAGGAIEGTAGDDFLSFVNVVLVDVPRVDAKEGNDTIEASTHTHDVVYIGGEGNDQLVGNQRRDILDGGIGNDTLLGDSGDDLLLPGLGDDIVDAGPGNDRIEMHGGNLLGDVVNGGSGYDVLINLDANTAMTFSSFSHSSNQIERIEGAGGAIEGTSGDNFLSFVNVVLVDVPRVDAKEGNDTIEASTHTHNVVYIGGEGNDQLLGNQRRDILDGGIGNDTLSGGSGDDLLLPGLGDDIVDAGPGNDRIEMHGGDLLGDTINGGSGNDVLINLDSNTAMKFSSFSHAANEIERIEGAGGVIEGTAGDDFLSFVNVVLVDVPRVDAKEGDDTIEASTHTHDVVYIGGEGNDQLLGNQRRDILDGGIGNDTLLGDSGDDLLLPGLGDDIVDAGPGNDRIEMHGGDLLGDIINGGSGYDVLINLDSNTALTFSSFSHSSNQIERVEGAGGAIEGTSGDNFLSFVNVVLVDVSRVDAKEGNDTIEASTHTHDVVYIGGEGNDQLIGNQRRDILDGGIGNDTLFGQSGDDLLLPGLGDDIVDAGPGNDRIEIHGGDLLGDAINGGSGYDVLINLDANTAMTFSSFSHAANEIERIEGAGGAIEGTSGDDFLSFVTVVLVDVPRVDAKEGNDTIEASTHTHDVVYIGGEGNDQLLGNQRRDILDGGIGNDTLFGDSGDDLLLPGLGDDIVDAGPGNDRIEMHGGDLLGDTINGGSGYDVLINLDANTAMTFSSFSHASNQIERVEGAGGAIEGTSGDNFLSFVNVVLVDVPRVDAKEGNDTIEASTHTHDVVYFGGEGNDQLLGNQRRDILDGGIGNDTLFGQSGDDLLLPGLGDDIVDAGPGNDRIEMHGGDLLGDVVNGDSGYDVLINLDSNTAMTFSSFSHASNQIERVEGAGGAIEGTSGDNFLSFVNVVLVDVPRVDAKEGNDTIEASTHTHDVVYFGGEGNDQLLGNQRRDILDGGIGNDTLFGQSGDDLLLPGLGDDIVDAGPGNDRIELHGGDTLGDAINGGSGYDVLINLDANTAMTFSSFSHAANEIERIEGAGGAIEGTAGDDFLSFVNVVLVDVPRVDAKEGNDTIEASTHTHDVVYIGGSGNDKLFGQNRRDILIGGSGDDLLFGGGSDDLFVIGEDEGVDTVQDFDASGNDRLDLSALGYLNFANLADEAVFEYGDFDDDELVDDTSIGFSAENGLRLLDLAFQELSESDFLF